MKFRPCIDLHKGQVRQIVGSTFSHTNEHSIVTNFKTDQSPAYFAELYKKDSLAGGHVIMLGQGNEAAAKEALLAFPQGLQIGGGITPDNAGEFLDAGASHVIVTSYVFKEGTIYWDNLKELENNVGKNRLVLDLSCKKKGGNYFIVTDRWQKFTDTAISAKNMEHLSSFCDEFLVHAVDVEGMRTGIDVELVRLLSRLSPITVTYAGGISSLEDLDTLNQEGNGRVDATVGSALDIFGGSLKYDDVVRWHKKQCSA
jgi:phosphoribosylformimino-5-aminoimidazole carboxamide ribotide isomerase